MNADRATLGTISESAALGRIARPSHPLKPISRLPGRLSPNGLRHITYDDKSDRRTDCWTAAMRLILKAMRGSRDNQPS